MNTRTFLDAPRACAHRHERGSAVIVVIAIVAILLIYIGGNLRTLHLLSRDLKQIEQKQIRRVSVQQPATNAPPAAVPVSWPVK